VVRSIVWMSERASRALGDLLSSQTVVVGSAREFFDARRDAKTVSFVDGSTIAALDKAVVELDLPIEQVDPVIAICGEPLHASIGWLASRPWLSHVVSAAMLQHPMSVQHFGNVMLTLTSGNHPRLLDWVGPTLSGRRVRLSQSSSRAQRLERMAEFFDSKGVGSRTVELLRDAGEELLTNAFYDAPVEAGALKQAISRTQQVSLPDDSACDMVYACHDDLAVVRVRDPFGSLSRARLVQVLTRCARTDMAVEVDETRGGAFVRGHRGGPRPLHRVSRRDRQAGAIGAAPVRLSPVLQGAWPKHAPVAATGFGLDQAVCQRFGDHRDQVGTR
jgi:hypothetical protein